MVIATRMCRADFMTLCRGFATSPPQSRAHGCGAKLATRDRVRLVAVAGGSATRSGRPYPLPTPVARIAAARWVVVPFVPVNFARATAGAKQATEDSPVSEEPQSARATTNVATSTTGINSTRNIHPAGWFAATPSPYATAGPNSAARFAAAARTDVATGGPGASAEGDVRGAASLEDLPRIGPAPAAVIATCGATARHASRTATADRQWQSAAKPQKQQPIAGNHGDDLSLGRR